MIKERNYGKLCAYPSVASHGRRMFIKWPFTPFMVHINFYISLFEVLIDSDVVDKWLSLLEGHFLIKIFSNRENITFALLKVVPHVKDWWDTYSEQSSIEESAIFLVSHTWDSFWDSIKE
jgi:hypothetical protein